MYNQQFGYRPAAVDRPTLESFASFLKQLDSNELESLERSQSRINEYVDNCDRVRHEQSEKENLLTSNKSLAEYNLSLEPKLNQAKVLLAQTHEQAVEISKRYDQSRMLLEGTPSRTSPDVQLALLQTESAKTEEECEHLSEEFLNKKLDIDTFLTKYIDRRTLSHIRKVKCEKMTELLRQTPSDHHRRQSAPAGKNANHPVAPGYSAYINTGAMPAYPPYPVAQNNSYSPYMPSYTPQMFGAPMSMPVATQYPSHYPGAYPQPSLH